MAEGRSVRPFLIGGAATAFVVAAAVMMFGGGGAKAGSFATLDVIEKTVSVREGATGEFRTGRQAESLKEGTTLKTGPQGLAGITYFDGSLTRVGPSATYRLVELKKPDGGKVIVGRLDVGETFHDVKKLTGSKSRFEVQTSSAVAAVRGTKMVTRCLRPLPCGVAVLEGKVVVRTRSGKVVTLTAGQRVTIDDDGNLSGLLLISADDAWINRMLQFDSTRSTTANVPTTSDTGTADTSAVPPTTSTTAVAPPTTRAGATTTSRRSTATTARSNTTVVQSTSTTRPQTTTSAPTTTTTAPTTTTTRPPTTTTRPPTTTTTRPPTTTAPPDPEPSASIAAEPSEPDGPGNRSNSPAVPPASWMWVLAFVGGVAWVNRHADEWS